MDRGSGRSTPPSGHPATPSPSPRSSAASDREREPELEPELARLPLFRALPEETFEAIARSARRESFADGDLVLDAFAGPSTDVFLIISGRASVWTDPDRLGQPPGAVLGPGQLFGFSAMLAGRSIGPRVVAEGPLLVAVLPATVAAPAFATAQGVRFLAEQSGFTGEPARRPSGAGGGDPPAYAVVDDLISTPPLIVDGGDDLARVARAMSEQHRRYAAVRTPSGRFGLITDAILRQRMIVDGVPGTTAAAAVMDPEAPVALLGDSAAEAQIRMFDREAEFLLVTDRNGQLRGVIEPRDFAVSAATLGVSLHEQIRRVTSAGELCHRAAQVPLMLAGLLQRGLTAGRVIAVHSTIIDTMVRRALVLTFAEHPELTLDAFTWLALGSNGRREAVLSSDVDSAVTFHEGLDDAEIARYRPVFGEVDHLLAQCGLASDGHGVTPAHAGFARTGAQWRAAAQAWMAAPEDNQGAIMTSLLVDGRPIYGDPGLPDAIRVFTELREHPGTMRLLLKESLSHRARLRSFRDVFGWPDTIDLKAQALLPIVNIARWAALGVGSAELATTERLKAASGSTILPDDQARTLAEVFEVLQRLRLRKQFEQRRRGETPSDVLAKTDLTPIERSTIGQAVREVAAVQRRMDQVSAYVSPRSWMSPASG